MSQFIVQINNNYQEILFVNDSEKISINPNIILKYKFFNNDIINYNIDTNHIDIIHSNIKKTKIVGILNINRKLIYGFNSKKNPYYLFKPLNKCFPNFYVAVNDKNLKNKNGKYYIVVKFNEWSKKIPSATIFKYIGPVGDKKCEIEKLLYFYDIDTRLYKLKQKINQSSSIYDVFDSNDLKNIKDMKHLNVFSIDPLGSRDIDDALSIQYKDDLKIIGIHIADVSTWFFKFKLDHFIKHNRFFTVYLNDKKFNLFPNILSDNLMSLIHKKDRLSLSLYITFDKNNNILDFYFQNDIINVQKNFSYEKFNNIFKKHTHFNDLFELSKSLKFSQINSDFDSHNMIENYMILANKLTAEYLINNNKNPILRSHSETKYNIDFSSIENHKLKNFLKIFQTKSAEYIQYNDKSTFNYFHFGLNINYYAHFTSPIRRVIDIINHIKIKQTLSLNHVPFDIDINKVNSVNKNLRKLDRQLNQIDKIDSIIDKNLICYLVDYKINHLYFYVPSINYYFKKIIYKNDDVLKNLQFQCNDSKFTIINKNTNQFIKLNKFFSYNIIIKKLLHSNDFYYNLINIDFQKII